MTSRYSLVHLSDEVLRRDFHGHVARERDDTAIVLAHIAEFDVRKLYLPGGYPSMHQYCVHELHFSEDAAYKRIHAARTARRFPAIFEALAGGKLHLSAVVLLAPYLTTHTARELIAAATHRTKSEIEKQLAERFPRPDLPARVQAILPPARQIVDAAPESRGPGRAVGVCKQPDRARAGASKPGTRPGACCIVRNTTQDHAAGTGTIRDSVHDESERPRQAAPCRRTPEPPGPFRRYGSRP